MIIVSQDKNKIINFDNIVHIFISGNSISYGVMSDTGANDLGTYKTEERAKEILQEITCQYAKNNLAHSPNLTLSCDTPSNYMPVYEMPNK